MSTKIYSDLVAWQRAMDFVESVYKATKCFPKEALYGLTSQLRRAAVSIPSNIAEGQGRDSQKVFLHHLSFAYGSLREAETQILIAGRLCYVNEPQLAELTDLAGEVGRLLNGLTKSLKNTL
jgi:four helix bundle protein